MEHETDNFISFAVAKKSEIELRHEMLSMEKTPSTRTGTPGGYVGLHIQRNARKWKAKFAFFIILIWLALGPGPRYVSSTGKCSNTIGVREALLWMKKDPRILLGSGTFRIWP